MTQLIETFLNMVHTNFLQKEWCDLNSTALNVDNYEDISQQEYYLLKYFPAYLAEYHVMYSKLFEMYERDSINVISIGCGAGIDYYALDTISDKPKINYDGVDIIDWSYKPNFSFTQMSISQLDSNHFENKDLIVFPKILTELSTEEVIKLAQTIADSALPNELYFLNSYITDNSNDSSRVDGIQKFKIICEKLKEIGYDMDGDNNCTQYTYFKENKGIRAHISSFVYPEDYKNFMVSLKNNCQEIDSESVECQKCNINVYPMMMSKYIAFNVIKFVKNDN